jgi:lysophospholipase L1-like esterase
MVKRLMHVVVFLTMLFATAAWLRETRLVPFCWLRPNYEAYKPAVFYTPDGIKVPVAEIANFLTGGGYLGGTENQHPRGRLTAGLRVKQGYDRPRWDYFDAQGCILVEHNSLGFRDDEFPVEKPAGEFRVLALGDSFTYGSGVLAKDAWPQVLERRLAEGGKKVQVINCGFACGTYTPAGYDTWMASDGLLLKPDLVVVGFCLNDMGNGNDIPMVGYQSVATSGWSMPLIDHFVTAYRNRVAKKNAPDFVSIVKAHPETWNATQDGLINLQRILAEKHVPMVVAVIPMISQLDVDPYPYGGLCEMIDGFCRDHAMAYVDLQSVLLGRNEFDLWVHVTDQHPNPEGQKLLGDGIFEFVKKQGWVPPAK